MISENNIASLVGSNVTDPENNKIGTVGQVYVDPGTGRPNWATVKTGLFGTKQSFVPLDEADVVGGDLRVPFSKDAVKDAPRVEDDAELSDAEEEELYAYYGGLGGTSAGGGGETGRVRDDGEQSKITGSVCDVVSAEPPWPTVAGMTIELSVLAWGCILGILHIFIAVWFKTRQYGTKWNVGARDEVRHSRDVAHVATAYSEATRS